MHSKNSDHLIGSCERHKKSAEEAHLEHGAEGHMSTDDMDTGDHLLLGPGDEKTDSVATTTTMASASTIPTPFGCTTCKVTHYGGGDYYGGDHYGGGPHGGGPGGYLLGGPLGGLLLGGPLGGGGGPLGGGSLCGPQHPIYKVAGVGFNFPW